MSKKWLWLTIGVVVLTAGPGWAQERDVRALKGLTKVRPVVALNGDTKQMKDREGWEELFTAVVLRTGVVKTEQNCKRVLCLWVEVHDRSHDGGPKSYIYQVSMKLLQLTTTQTESGEFVHFRFGETWWHPGCFGIVPHSQGEVNIRGTIENIMDGFVVDHHKANTKDAEEKAPGED